MLNKQENKELIKQSAIKEVVEREGGYVKHKNDRGGATRYGITEGKARRHGYDGDMKDLPLSLAIEIYKSEFWEHLRIDDLFSVSPSLALYLFDFSVNSGRTGAVKHLQRLINVLNNQGQFYDDIDVDGGIGDQTVEAINSLVKRRGGQGKTVLARTLNSLRVSYCVDISENDETQESFTFGWLSRVIDMEKEVEMKIKAAA